VKRLYLLLGLLAAVPAQADDPPANSRWNWHMFPSGISVNVRTGEVRVPPGMSLDRASRLFWNDMAILKQTPRPFPNEEPPHDSPTR
jgi:hypothetical protein